MSIHYNINGRQIPKDVLDFLRAEDEAITAEISALNAEKREHLNAVSNIEARQTDLALRQEAIRKIAPPIEESGQISILIKKSEQSTENSLADTGIREAIVSVLKTDTPMSPIEVADAMKSRGFPDEGKTSLSVRVGNDLHKLAQAMRVWRVGRGQYRLPTKDEKELLG